MLKTGDEGYKMGIWNKVYSNGKLIILKRIQQSQRSNTLVNDNINFVDYSVVRNLSNGKQKMVIRRTLNMRRYSVMEILLLKDKCHLWWYNHTRIKEVNVVVMMGQWYSGLTVVIVDRLQGVIGRTKWKWIYREMDKDLDNQVKFRLCVSEWSKSWVSENLEMEKRVQKLKLAAYNITTGAPEIGFVFTCKVVIYWLMITMADVLSGGKLGVWNCSLKQVESGKQKALFMYGILQMDWTHIDNNEKLSSWWMGVCGNVLWPEDVESVEQTKTILNNEGDKPSLWELMEGRLWCSRIASKGLMGSSCLDGKNVTQERHEANSSKQMNAGTGEGMYGNNMADRKTKSYKGAVTLGNTADEGTKTGRYEQKWRFRGVSSLRPIVETAKADKSKSVCRPLFQQKKEVERDTVEMVSQTAEPEVHEPTEQSEVQPNLTEENEHPTQNEELEGDGIELTLSEEEAVNAAGDVDFEQEDTLLYTEDDLLEDMAFCAAVANVDSMTEADRIIIHSEFEQNLKKCRVSEQPAQHGGPSKTTSKNNTPIRGVRFKKALALKAMSPRKTPKNKITKESTTREKDKSPMKF